MKPGRMQKSIVSSWRTTFEIMGFVLFLIGLFHSFCDAQADAPSAPPLPWKAAVDARHPPGVPGEDYRPVFVPNGSTLPFHIVDGVKVFHLVAEPIIHEVARGLTIHAWGFNGSTPGPVMELMEGDRVRIYVSNRLPRKTAVHWHGVILPCGQDGVYGVTQPGIMPGETFRYEFTFPHAGTFMYHSHMDTMTQEGLGLTGMIVVHPRHPKGPLPDRDFVLMLHEWGIEGGTSRPDAQVMTDFNVITFNGKVFPDTYPLVAKLGDRVRIRLGNLSAMDHHPIHLHGYAFEVVETDGGRVPVSARWPETTVLVPVGSVRVVEFVADNPGDWAMHCHMTHHTMNQMGHGFPNMIGVDSKGVDEKIRELLPGYMTMGVTGMTPLQSMKSMGMEVPENSIPMLGYKGQFGQTVMGGMATVFKVRKEASGYEDPGPYAFPEGSVAREATALEMTRDGIQASDIDIKAPKANHPDSAHSINLP
ncbi:MAG: copper oxidase [Deltaproteobacteria bacterium]|nr:copper oxidase [Deltaproteobacteria bacterium]